MLKPRLQKIYDLIGHNCMHVVDVGCDHAWLSIALLLNKKAAFVTNIDKNIKPLENGQNNALSKGVFSKTHFICNDGLNNLVLALHINYLCISGMGADNIIQIIKKNENLTDYYILQPNTDNAVLKKYLYENNYHIIKETLVVENNITYEIIMATHAKKQAKYQLVDLYVGKYLKKQKSVVVKNYFINRYKFLSPIIHVTKNDILKEEYKVLQKFLYDKKWIN